MGGDVLFVMTLDLLCGVDGSPSMPGIISKVIQERTARQGTVRQIRFSVPVILACRCGKIVYGTIQVGG